VTPQGGKRGSPVVSVIIPTYNRAQFISEAVESALADRDAVDLEVIVVDDGSTDETSEVVSAFGDAVRYLHQANAGASSARNAGIRAARGKWVALLDSDDVWMPGKLTHQLAELRAHPEAVAHFTNALIDRPFVRSGDLVTLLGIADCFPPEGPALFERPLVFNLKHNLARNQSALIRREVLLACGLFNERYPFFQDTDIMNRVALEGPWVASPEVFVHELRRKETTVGIGEQRSREPYRGYEVLVDQMKGLLDDRRLTRAERRVARDRLARYAFLAAAEWIRAGSNRSARKALAVGFGRSIRLKNAVTYFLSLAPNALLRKLVFKKVACRGG